jgi:hypothetical protein
MKLQDVRDLIGEDLRSDPLGENMAGDPLAGYIPERTILFVPQVQLGPALVGPPNDQPLEIYRDDRPIATDELGMQGPFIWRKLARRSAGRTFPLNYEWGATLDPQLPGMLPEQQTRGPSPLSPGQDPLLHDGVQPVEVLPTTRTVWYTASPDVGWVGY